MSGAIRTAILHGMTASPGNEDAVLAALNAAGFVVVPDATDAKTADLLARLADLHKQATEERSHYYVGSLVRECMTTILALAAFTEHP